MTEEKRERETITKEDVGELDVSNVGLDSRLDDAKTEGSDLKMESAKVEVSGDQGFGPNLPYPYDAVFGFASYLANGQVFEIGHRADASLLVEKAAIFCSENGWEDASKDFPKNINFPKK